MSYNLVDPTTGDLTRVAGGGFSIPVGTLISQYKKKPMRGYLYCDGSTFNENAYPALYMYLGTNVLPDYRECVMVGAEQNTTDTITTHDVYGEGEFKDDQIQSHRHNATPNLMYPASGSWTGRGIGIGNTGSPASDTLTVDNTYNARVGETTHGKQKAVYVYIKATSGLAENQQDNVLNDVKRYVDDKVAQCVESKSPNAKTVSFELNSNSWNCGTIYGNTNNGGNFKYDYYVTSPGNIELIKQDGYGQQGSITASLSGTTLTLTADGNTTIKTVTIIKS